METPGRKENAEKNGLVKERSYEMDVNKSLLSKGTRHPYRSTGVQTQDSGWALPSPSPASGSSSVKTRPCLPLGDAVRLSGDGLRKDALKGATSRDHAQDHRGAYGGGGLPGSGAGNSSWARWTSALPEGWKEGIGQGVLVKNTACGMAWRQESRAHACTQPVGKTEC